MITFSLLIIFGTSETRVASFYAGLCMFSVSSTETNSSALLSFLFSAISFPSETFFHSHTLTLSLNFNNIKKLKHLLTCETLCNRYIVIKCIIRFLIRKCVVYNVWSNRLKINMTSVFKIPFQFNYN